MSENLPLMTEKEAMTHRVLLLVFPEFQLLDATGPADVFAAVDEHLPATGRPAYLLQAISLLGGLIASSSGLAMATQPLPEPQQLVGCTLLVAGGHGVQRALQQGQLTRWLGQAGPLAARCASVCTGAFLLAQAGLMTGRKMVTHWRYAELLQRLYRAWRSCMTACSSAMGPSTARLGLRRGWIFA